MEETEEQRLRHLVNDGKYEQAFLFFQNLPQDRPEFLGKLAVDTIFDAVTKFRDNNDDDLRALVISLFDAVQSELLKFRICFNFITSRSTPHLNKVLINQLGFLMTSDFKMRHPAEWQELQKDLPQKLVEKLPPDDDVNVLYPSLETAHILFFFKEVPFTIPQRMFKVFARAINSSEPELPNAFPLLVFHSRSHPFSPKLHHLFSNINIHLVDVSWPTVLIPFVYRRYFLARKLMEGLIVYVQENEYNYERHFVKPIANALNRVVMNLEDLDFCDIDLCCKLILPLLRFVEDFDQRSYRVPIMNKCEEIIHMFPSCQRSVLFRNLLPRIFDNSDLGLDNESTVVAWLIDQYRRYLDEEPFREELGSFLGILEDVRYSEMLQASNYYSAIFCLIQTLAIKRFNLDMLPEVEKRLLTPIYAQLKDYIQLEEMRKKDESQKKETVPKIPEGIQVEIGTPAPEGSVVDQLQLLVFGCEQAKSFIAKAMNSAK